MKKWPIASRKYPSWTLVILGKDILGCILIKALNNGHTHRLAFILIMLVTGDSDNYTSTGVKVGNTEEQRLRGSETAKKQRDRETKR